MSRDRPTESVLGMDGWRGRYRRLDSDKLSPEQATYIRERRLKRRVLSDVVKIWTNISRVGVGTYYLPLE